MDTYIVPKKSAIATEALQGIEKIQYILGNESEQIYRPMPWRNNNDPYAVLVSEVMLQQTQVSRIRKHYPHFLQCFPTITALAQASSADVIRAWQGLGYNRRALFIHRAAQRIVEQHGGCVPQTSAELASLPGIGPATAGAIRVYAYNLPALFIETNIRRVFIFYCFPDDEQVADSDIEPLLAYALPRDNYRTWYYALTDLGALLSVRVGRNPNRHAKQYRRQSSFVGSVRQLRGAIIRHLSHHGTAHISALEEIACEYSTSVAARNVIAALHNEGFIVQDNDTVYLPD